MLNKKDKTTYYEANDDYEEYYDNGSDRDEERKNIFLTRLFVVFMIYLIYLILGVFSTSFTVNKLGEREAQVITVELRNERKDYYEIRDHYIVLRNLIMKIEEIDGQLAESSEEDYFFLSTEYSNYLPIINDNLVKAKALTTPQKYNEVKKQTVSLYDTTSIYLQKMSSVLMTKNNTTLIEANSWKETMYQDFYSFENNLFNFSRMVKLEDKIFKNK